MVRQKVTTIERLGPNVRGYLACLLDQNGRASYNQSHNRLTLGINGVGDPYLQTDLKSWMGGWVEFSESAGDRRGCVHHCKTKHIHFSRRSYRWVVTGTRALFVLSTLEPSLRTWRAKFAEPYQVGLSTSADSPRMSSTKWSQRAGTNRYNQ